MPRSFQPVFDYGPLLVFLLAYFAGGMFVATAALMAATILAIIGSLVMGLRVSPLLLITTVMVLIFGGLTLWLQDENFIKLKPTIIYGLFATLLAGGLASGKPVLKSLMGSGLQLDDGGWRRLSWRFVIFFLVMALANEGARRWLSTDLWVIWKVPGSIMATILFMLAQWRLLRQHQVTGD
ncbi:MAG TPA: septation protein IspZ [Rhodospirillaceae bacterium]|nr:septation protein IspZ [Rhodospirillaceae bacterium]